MPERVRVGLTARRTENNTIISSALERETDKWFNGKTTVAEVRQIIRNNAIAQEVYDRVRVLAENQGAQPLKADIAGVRVVGMAMFGKFDKAEGIF